LDQQSFFGARTENFFSGGITRKTRTNNFFSNTGTNTIYYGKGDVIVHAVGAGYSGTVATNLSPTGPHEDNSSGDDVVIITSPNTSPYTLENEFPKVTVGDSCYVTYITTISGGASTSVTVQAYIKEIRTQLGTLGGPNTYFLRLDKKNYATTGTVGSTTISAFVYICKPSYSLESSGILAPSIVNNANSAIPSSLIIANPTGAFTLGQDFSPSLFDYSHYMLYLAFYPTGVATVFNIVAIDVTGNQGLTPGLYTQDSIVASMNAAFRATNANFRFVAYKYEREIGIMLADSYEGASFSVICGNFDGSSGGAGWTAGLYINNVVDTINTAGSIEGQDPFGFGPRGTNIASAAPLISGAGSATWAAAAPLFMITPHQKNYFYVNTNQSSSLYSYGSAILPTTAVANIGNYWNAIVSAVSHGTDGFSPNHNLLQTTYRVFEELDTANLVKGKTLVVLPQPNSNYDYNYGRFIIQDVVTSCGTDTYTDITVYDATSAYFGSVVGGGLTPYSPLPTNAASVDHYQVRLLFSADSVGFNTENLEDASPSTPFERYFEVFVDQQSKTFSVERARKILGTGPTRTINGIAFATFTNSQIFNIVSVSPKLKGFVRQASSVITLVITGFTSSTYATYVYTGYLCNYNTSTHAQTRKGPVTSGKAGLITRFYNDSFEDHIDIKLNLSDIATAATISYPVIVDIETFPSLQSNKEVLLVCGCNYCDNNYSVTSGSSINVKIANVNDSREFGIISVEEFNNEAIDYISQYERYTRSNGVIRGFDIDTDGVDGNIPPIEFRIKGGVVAIKGKIIIVNDQILAPKNLLIVPYSIPVTFWVCANKEGELVLLPATPPAANYSTIPYSTISEVGYIYGSTFNTYSVFFYCLADIYAMSDLVVLHSVQRDITNHFNTLDYRKYNNATDNAISYKVSDTAGYGNFNSFSALINWMVGCNQLVNNVIINSASTYSGVLNLSGNYIFDGQNIGSLGLSGTSNTLSGNITFKNLTINLTGTIFTLVGTGNIVFDNCIINFGSNFIDGTGFSGNLKITNCVITCSGTTTILDTITTQLGNITFSNNSVQTTVTPTNLGALTNIPKLINVNPGRFSGIVIDNIVVENNIVTLSNYFVGINIEDSTANPSNIFIRKNNITSSCDAASATAIYCRDVTPSFGATIISNNEKDYLTSLKDGFVYIEAYSSNINSLNISENVFQWQANWNGSSSRKRFPYICFVCGASGSSQSLVINIDKNKFNTTGLTGDTSNSTAGIYPNSADHKAAIVIGFKNTGAALGGTQPTLSIISGSISENQCYQRQGIIISHIENDPAWIFGTNTDVGQNSIFKNLLACGNLRIEYNGCGYIGTLLTTTTPTISNYGASNSATDIGDSTNGLMLNKIGKLSIKGNNCLWITNLTANGRYIYPYNVDIIVGTGVTGAGTTTSLTSTVISSTFANSSTLISMVNNIATTLNPQFAVYGTKNISNTYINLSRSSSTPIFQSNPISYINYSGNVLTINYGNPDGSTTTASSSMTFSIYCLTDVLNFDLCPMDISENVCSWIHVIGSTEHQISAGATARPATSAGNITIRDNKLMANDYNFLKLFPCQLFYSNRSGWTCNAYPQFDSATPTAYNKYFHYQQFPSALFGCCQAFAISVLSNTGMGVSVTNINNPGKSNYINTASSPSLMTSSTKTVISGNIIEPQFVQDNTHITTTNFQYGLDAISNTSPADTTNLGGGFINCQTPSVITNNTCSKFWGSSPYMRMGLITVGDTATITGNTLSRTPNSTATYNCIWNYISVAPIFNGLCTSSDFLTQQYTPVYLNALAPSLQYPIGTDVIHPAGIISNNIFESAKCSDIPWTNAYNNVSDNTTVVDTGNLNVTSSTNWSVFTTSYIPNGWICTQNKNQTDVLSIALGGETTTNAAGDPTYIYGNSNAGASLLGGYTSTDIFGNYTGNQILPSNILTFNINSTGVGFMFQTFVNISARLPTGAIISKIEIELLPVGTSVVFTTGVLAGVSLSLGSIPDNIYTSQPTSGSYGSSMFTYSNIVSPTLNRFYGTNGYVNTYKNFSANDFTNHLAAPLRITTLPTALSTNNNVVKSDHNYSTNVYVNISANLPSPTSSSYKLYLSPLYIYYTY
jgi:hypothetical protein